MKVQNPIIGRARGSAGGMTFCKNYDKNVARAKAFEVSNPKTQAQQTQRAFFGELTALCSDFSDDQLRFLFPSKPKTMSRRNALSKQIAESFAIDGTIKSIDYADIDTLGNAPVMNFGNVEIVKTQDSIIITLDETNPGLEQFKNNALLYVIINETKGAMTLPIDATSIEDNDYSILYPPKWEQADTINAIPLISNYVFGSGSTISFRTMSVAKRPARKGRNPRTGQVNG